MDSTPSPRTWPHATSDDLLEQCLPAVIRGWVTKGGKILDPRIQLVWAYLWQRGHGRFPCVVEFTGAELGRYFFTRSDSRPVEWVSKLADEGLLEFIHRHQGPVGGYEVRLPDPAAIRGMRLRRPDPQLDLPIEIPPDVLSLHDDKPPRSDLCAEVPPDTSAQAPLRGGLPTLGKDAIKPPRSDLCAEVSSALPTYLLPTDRRPSEMIWETNRQDPQFIQKSAALFNEIGDENLFYQFAMTTVMLLEMGDLTKGQVRGLIQDHPYDFQDGLKTLVGREPCRKPILKTYMKQQHDIKWNRRYDDSPHMKAQQKQQGRYRR